ncbi:MAG: prepilin-type N-terminal cleavage/methylation domain-containing protein [Rhodoferax sp.]|nr:prepilin-type N-terminal cleavage/methylation domain-containing protein [Rhodoferax sp.]
MKSFNTSRSRQSGFTLVEIAIVLVIIGLLLGGVLKGQELIENSKTKAIVNDMKAIQAAYNGYIDRYKAIPGDETAATMLARGWAGTAGAPAGTAGNGVLNITAAQTFTSGAAATEAAAYWRGLRASGLLAGDPTVVAVAALPRHASGGLLGVTSDPAGIYGQSGTFVCAAGLSTKQAAAIDALVDGALPATNIGNNVGTLRAATNAANPLAPANAAPAALAYNETTTTTPWTVCMRI